VKQMKEYTFRFHTLPEHSGVEIFLFGLPYSFAFEGVEMDIERITE